MATKYRLQDVAQLVGKDVFFDANILIYLFWPTGQYNFEQNYARVFSNLLRQGNNLFVDFLVISEVINRVVRIEHQKLNPTQKFKDFRNSQDGKDALDDIYIIVKNDILNRFNVVGKAFNKQEIESYLAVDELDFVDKATVTLCKENALVLLTNDKDFKNADLDILTGNPSILN
ncbi:MAG: type II toxin-antitoxin system VapC family toxin [Cytophagales bacterium]|nr:MAG: type II toxin-antitoxin system VapC family toxin [Cytophagales bacterium]TAF59664.1 MAG: type II toxin-antitoxin system VapC family toxin [Cytophagales bacterium]